MPSAAFSSCLFSPQSDQRVVRSLGTLTMVLAYCWRPTSGPKTRQCPFLPLQGQVLPLNPATQPDPHIKVGMKSGQRRHYYIYFKEEMIAEA